MGATFCRREDGSEEHNQKFQKDGGNDITNGPVKSRGCTDIVCLIIYLSFWGLFVFVIFLGVADGNPSKLYRPRDYKGDYCGVEKQWNDGLNLENFEQRTYTMNTTSTVDLVAKQLTCSSASAAALNSILTAAQLTEYRCACCLDACASCTGSLPVDDLASPADVSTTINGKMTELNGFGSETAVYSSSSFNGDFISNMWEEATKYFQAVCLKKCSTPYDGMGSSTRTYTYRPSPDAAWKTAWNVLATDATVPADIRNTIDTSFVFKALPTDVCPYEARYCVPFPGVNFKELTADYCTFEIAANVVNQIGSASAGAYEELGANDVADKVTDSFGDAVGDFMKTLDAFAVVCTLSLVIGLVFLVLLRFVVGCIVWFSIGAVFCALVLVGGFSYLRSGQCKGASLFETGKNAGEASLVVASTQVSGGTGMSEAMSGNGADYRGAQTKTRTGRSCQAWATQNAPHNHTTTPTTYPSAGLDSNYCRNPESAPTIWCFTSDPDVRWELCSPIGVILPGCPEGYVVTSETFRDALKVFAYIFWILAFFWLVAVCCLCKQIRLAIGINKVAAMFVYETKTIVLVPLVQILVGILWFMVWALCVSFLLSQVPEGYTPTGAFQTYSVAYGTDDDPGKCTDQPTQGFVGNMKVIMRPPTIHVAEILETTQV
jgi:hypothetical protein